MHANIDQLLDIINGEQSSIREHLIKCEQCQAALNELQSFESEVGLQMFDAADQVASDDIWNRIENSLDQQQQQQPTASVASNVHAFRAPPQQSLTRAVYALAASIAFVGVVSVFMFSKQQDSQLQNQVIQASLNELMLNSRGLEHVLQNVAEQNQALSLVNQKAADRLYWRLTYLDQLIEQASPESPERIEVLWNDRIDALNELNQIYYQRESTLNAPEI
jgi:hypothetical protein